MNTQSRSFQPPALSVTDELKRLCTQVDFASSENKPLSPQLFDKLASNIANELNNRNKDCNKSSQIRRFFDELVGWEQKIGSDPKGFEMNEAFFRMLKAKVAYAFGRNRDERKGKVGLVPVGYQRQTKTNRIVADLSDGFLCKRKNSKS